MFNLLISGSAIAWESNQRMSMQTSRFREYSGDECEGISSESPETLKRLERLQSLLLYECGVHEPQGDVARIGQMRDIRVSAGQITFRFTETGQVPRAKVFELSHRLQMDEWEKGRTHWAIKDGEIPQEIFLAMIPTPKSYDVVLSFAGEEREYVEYVADYLNTRGISVFYDMYEMATLWGKNLVEHFDGVYRKQARYCVMFISRHYAEKVWAKYEGRAALARALGERVEYILPARFDETEIPGLNPAIAYIDLRTMPPQEIGNLIIQKLGRI